jgi:hypothetical protein
VPLVQLWLITIVCWALTRMGGICLRSCLYYGALEVFVVGDVHTMPNRPSNLRASLW